MYGRRKMTTYLVAAVTPINPNDTGYTSIAFRGNPYWNELPHQSAVSQTPTTRAWFHSAPPGMGWVGTRLASADRAGRWLGKVGADFLSSGC
jgi:hypothetical protein